MALRLADDYGCAGVLVDATAVTFYEKLGFTLLEIVEGQSDVRPAPAPMLLALADIEAARRSSRP